MKTRTDQEVIRSIRPVSWRNVRLAPRLFSLILILGTWYALSTVLSQVLLPSPQAVAIEIGRFTSSGEFVTHAVATLGRVLIGFVLAIVMGFVIGSLMGVSDYFERFFRTWVIAGLSIPGLIWALMGVIWFGISVWAILLAIVLITAPYVAVNIFEGVRAVERELLDMARSYRIRRLEIFRRIILPSMVPFIMAAVRHCFANCWKMATVAEVFGATTGIGFMIRLNFDIFNLAGIVAWTLAFTAIVLLIEYGIIGPLQRYLLRWRPAIGELF